MLAQILPFIGVDPSRYTPRIIRDGLLEHARTARSVHYPKMVASALRLYVHLQGPLAPAKGAEVGHGPIHASQLKQALDEPGRLPQWQPEQDLHL